MKIVGFLILALAPDLAPVGVYAHMGYDGDPFVPTATRLACTGTSADLWDCVCVAGIRCHSHRQVQRPFPDSNIVLGEFEEFAVMGALITCTVGDTVYGNLGVPTVAGTIGAVVLGSNDEEGVPNQEGYTEHRGDAVAVAGWTDLQNLMNGLWDLRPGYLLGGTADISLFTFYPGVYSTTTTMAIAVGSVYLDALGNIHAIFVFSAVKSQFEYLLIASNIF